MAKRWFFGFAFDRPLAEGWPPFPFAEATLDRLTSVLAPLGFASHVLRGHEATAAVVASRLRRCLRQLHATDHLLIYYTGFAYGGTAPCLATWDTQLEDLPETGLPLLPWLQALARQVCQVVLVLDLLTLNDLPAASLHALAEEISNLGMIAFQQDSSKSQAVPKLKTRLSGLALADALAGHIPAAITNRKTLTAKSFCDALQDVLPRLARRHVDHGQEPQFRLHGRAEAEIADLSSIVADSPSLLSPDRLARVAFRSESITKVKELSAFRKTYQVPEAASPSARKFIARLSQTDLRQDLEDLVNVIREPLHLRRKDLEMAIEDGYGLLRTPLFTYSVAAQLHADDPSRVRWIRELTHFREASFLTSPLFQKYLAPRFDQLALEFRQAVDVDALVDQLEDQPIPGVKLQLSAEGSELSLTGYTGRIRLLRHALIVQGRGGLLDQLLAFLGLFQTLGEPKALPDQSSSTRRAAH